PHLDLRPRRSGRRRHPRSRMKLRVPGLPTPTPLRRYSPGQPLVDGPVLVGAAPGGRLQTAISQIASSPSTSAEISPSPSGGGQAGGSWGAIIFDATGITDVAGLSALHAFIAPAFRNLRPSARVVRLRPATAVPAPDWDHPLKDRVAVVTGGARGIGAAIAQILARDGARVVVADVPAQGAALAEVANQVGGTAFQVDITSDDAPARLSAHLKDRHGGADIFVHNAGITRDRSLVNLTADQWSSVLAVNLEAQLRINSALLEQKVLQPNARVICISSTSGIAGNRGQTNYAASKAGIIGMVQALAPAMAERNMTINAVAPGFIETAMTNAMPFATRQLRRPINRLHQGGLAVGVGEARP